MPEEQGKQVTNDQDAYDKVFDAVVGNPRPADPPPVVAAPESEPITVEPAKTVEPVQPENQLIFGKYKTMEAALKGFKDLETYVAGVKEYRELEKKLKDPATAQQALTELSAKLGFSLPEAKPEVKKPEPGEITDITDFEDDDIITGASLKKTLPALIATAVAQAVEKSGKTPEMAQVLSVVKPMVEQQHRETIKSRGGVFALYDDPVLSAARNEIIEADETGKEGRDVHAHYAALGKLIDDAVRSDGAKLPDLIASLVQKKNAQPETATVEVTTPTLRAEPMSAEDKEQAQYDAIFDIVPGRG